MLRQRRTHMATPIKEFRKNTYVAIPLRENGRERMGTAGTLRGEYRSFQNFRRYFFDKHAVEDMMYNVYYVQEATRDWIKIAIGIKPRRPQNG